MEYKRVPAGSGTRSGHFLQPERVSGANGGVDPVNGTLCVGPECIVEVFERS